MYSPGMITICLLLIENSTNSSYDIWFNLEPSLGQTYKSTISNYKILFWIKTFRILAQTYFRKLMLHILDKINNLWNWIVFLNGTPSKKSCTWARKVQCLVRHVLVLQKMSEENQEMVEPKDTSQISRSSSTFQWFQNENIYFHWLNNSFSIYIDVKGPEL